ncbi:hypothetical protein GGE67_001952 [Rhizobium leucaenae]|uniref:Uncharacterized protein n=1 Tax=Rhizobium leucaenae TaxID=29450 RepID=A0A7W7EIY4_9HYPH|nr:hypothetical protein [Rhizobium leucaenae]MBB6301343.1 hypothetical protein [Rhizobium leucaenae]
MLAKSIFPAPAGWSSTRPIVGNRDLIGAAIAREASQAVPLRGSYDGRRSGFSGMIVQVNTMTG